MTQVYDLSSLNPAAFEHLVGALALQVLGAGVSSFGPGPDGGRDGLFIGEAPYPSTSERWKGTWYLQAKFHGPKVSGDEQKWLLRQIKEELQAFGNKKSERIWPDIWIVATNVDPSGVAKKGTHDKARALVQEARPKLAKRFHVWGGTKILDLLSQHQEIATRYGHFLTPGHVLSALAQSLADQSASVERIVDFLVTEAIEDSKFAKLEQAGSAADSRPGLHRLFTDVPFSSGDQLTDDQVRGAKALATMSTAAAENHRAKAPFSNHDSWIAYWRHPRRARVWVVRGGPGQGKSTLGQFYCQIQRAALILQASIGQSDQTHWPVSNETRLLAREIRDAAERLGPSVWPLVARIPIYLELKDYAAWLSRRGAEDSTNILSYLAAKVRQRIGSTVAVATLERALSTRSWAIVFDGLDEVPSAIKHDVVQKIASFMRRMAPRSDLFGLCTSRPQGYTGQFDQLGGATIELTPLSVDEALLSAEPLIRLGRSQADGDRGFAILKDSAKSSAVQSLMKTPLQAHIMAVIVRAGQRPPKMRWRLYERFYDVIFARERDKGHADPRLQQIFEEDEEILTQVHDHAGFLLHAISETAKGSEATLSTEDFEKVARRLVERHKAADHQAILDSLVLAAKERLVLLSTPDEAGEVRYDVRQLQEFFAARFLFHDTDLDTLRERLELIAGDAHWREVMHFLMSALIDSKRRNELGVAIEVLTWLDQGEGDEKTARFCTRLARGGRIAARLLEDGVLEGSKVDRLRFRELMRSCLSVDDLELLQPLRSVEGSASRAWLSGLLMDHVSTRKSAEALGAMALLWDLVEDHDPAIPTLIAQVQAAPVSVLEWAIESSSPRDQSLCKKRWQQQAILQLCQPSIVRELAESMIVLRSSWISSALSEIWSSRVESDDERLMRWFLDRDLEGKPPEQDTNYGWIDLLECYPWEPESDSDLLAIVARMAERPQNDDLALLRSALKMECHPSKENILRFLELAKKDQRWNFLGTSLAGRLQVFDLDRLTSVIEANSEEAIERTILDEALLTRYHFVYRRGGTAEQFLRLLRDLPFLAAVRWRGMPNAKLLNPLILDKILQADTALMLSPPLGSPLLWHHFLHLDGADRDALVERCPMIDSVNYFLGRHSDPAVGSFRLRLPDEQRVLLRLGLDLLSLSPARQGLAVEFVENPSDLEYIACDASTPAPCRLGAILLGLAHPKGGVDFLLRYRDFLLQVAHAWPRAIEAVLYALDERNAWIDEGVRQFIDRLIDKMPVPASSYRPWVQLYRSCREHSQAPVTSARCAEEWMNCSG